MNKLLRNCLLRSRIPLLCNVAIRSLRRRHAERHGAFQAALYPQLYPQGGSPRVLNGPFAGMLYLNESVWGSITPRWIGSYESCLWHAVREIISKRYSCIIDVGCAEGYYAVGLCRAVPQAAVYAHDMDPYSLAQAERLWKLNGCPGTLQTGRRLDARQLNRLGQPGSLLICDIEGGEMDLLDPFACAALLKMDLLIEVHRLGDKDATTNAAILRQRFAPTHDISSFDDTQRVRQLAGVSALDQATLDRAISEGRPYAQVWLWVKCRRRPHGKETL